MNKIKNFVLKLEQFLKFMIVGCSNTIISLAVYYLCVYVGIHYIISYLVGFLGSVCNAFYWNNKYIFKNKQEHSVIKSFGKVFISYGLSFLLSLVLISLMVEFLGISSYIAPILKLVLTMPLNFFLNKTWAFRDKKYI